MTNMRPDEDAACQRVEALVPERECTRHGDKSVPCEVLLVNTERLAALTGEMLTAAQNNDMSLSLRLLLRCGKIAGSLCDQFLDEMDDPKEAMKIMIEGKSPHVQVFFLDSDSGN